MVLSESFSLNTYIGIELPDKAREIVVFEGDRKKMVRECSRIRDHKTIAIFVPRYDIICLRIIH